MTDFEWLDSGPNCSEGHYSMHSKNPHLSPSLYTTTTALGPCNGNKGDYITSGVTVN